MERLRFLARRYNVVIRFGGRDLHASLTHRFGRPSLLLVGEGLHEQQRLPAAAALLHVAALGWVGDEHRITFPMPGDDAATITRIARQLRVYRLPRKLGLRDLMPAPWLEAKEREEAEPAEAAAEAGVSLADLVFRVADWRHERWRKVKAVPARLDQLIAQGLVRRASELPAAVARQSRPQVPSLQVLPPLPPAAARAKAQSVFTRDLSDPALRPMLVNPPPAPERSPLTPEQAERERINRLNLLAGRRPNAYRDLMRVYRERAGSFDQEAR